MLYRHQFFVLDENNKKTFDENGKELRLTGNAYRLLFFLCKNRSANLTQIGDFFDFANNYSENHIRQYRYKINMVIGYDVIEYKNGLYSIKGDIQELERVDITRRNTELLRGDGLLFGSNEGGEVKEPFDLKLNVYPAIFASIMLLLTLFKWPYAFYTLLRLAITGIGVYYVYYIYSIKGKKCRWLWPFAVVIILFNPIAPIYLYKKGIWTVIDLIVVGFLLVFIFVFRKAHKRI
jgi:hypothetical protein